MLSAAQLNAPQLWRFPASPGDERPASPVGAWPPPRGLPTGFPQLDRATGTGGVPLGRITELYGGGAPGLAGQIVAEVRRRGLSVACIDLAPNLSSPRAWGQPPGQLLLLDSQDGPQGRSDGSFQDGSQDGSRLRSEAAQRAWQLALGLVSSAQIPLTVLQVSHPAGVRSPGLPSPGVARGLAAEVARRQVALVLVAPGAGEVAPEAQRPDRLASWNSLHPHRTHDAGHALADLRRQAALRVQVQPEGWLRRGPDVVGQKVRVTITRNRGAAPHPSLLLRLWRAP